MLPIVTMIRLFVHIETQLTLAMILVGSVTYAWVMMPAGLKYMFATECSKLLETKAMIGNQMPKNLPTRSSAQMPRRMARLTSQLQATALRNADHIPIIPT